MDFEKWVQVDDLANQERMFQKIKRIIQQNFPDAKFSLFGSTGANLAIKGSDIDIAVIDKDVDFPTLFNVSNSLLLKDDGFAYVERVVCSVPILKLKDKTSGMTADITFNRQDSYRGVHCALNMQIQFPELRPLYFVIKTFLRERSGLDQTYSGGVCSIMILNMITYYL